MLQLIAALLGLVYLVGDQLQRMKLYKDYRLAILQVSLFLCNEAIYHMEHSDKKTADEALKDFQEFQSLYE